MSLLSTTLTSLETDNDGYTLVANKNNRKRAKAGISSDSDNEHSARLIKPSRSPTPTTMTALMAQAPKRPERTIYIKKIPTIYHNHKVLSNLFTRVNLDVYQLYIYGGNEAKITVGDPKV